LYLKGRNLFRRLLLIIFFLCCTGIGALFYLFEKEWIDFSTLGYYSNAKPSIVLDEEEREIGRFELDRRDPTTYDKMPDLLIKAFVAAEDHHFFEHPGISIKGIIRSFLVNLYHGRVVQGASTITQQLARGMFLYYDRTLWRKIQEIFIAFQLERQLSKEQIMELYLNNIYFGRGTYGVEAAGRRFWNKSLDQLTTAEAATLAAVAASARLYSPLNAPCSAKKRRNVIITAMYKLGFITNKECERAKKEKLKVLDFVQGNPIRLYILEWIRMWAESIWGKEALYRKGLRIQTSINLDIQAAAEKSFANVVTILRNGR
jgi:penicillin-binding protein 1A